MLRSNLIKKQLDSWTLEMSIFNEIIVERLFHFFVYFRIFQDLFAVILRIYSLVPLFYFSFGEVINVIISLSQKATFLENIQCSFLGVENRHFFTGQNKTLLKGARQYCNIPK